MAAPSVQSLADIMAQLEAAYTPARSLYQQQIDAIPGQTNTQLQGLDTAKANAFTDVNNNANSKGLAFSGIPVQEQSRYLGEKYLPAVANVQATANNQKLTLQQQLAQLYQDQYTKAIGTQQGQQSSLDQYNQASEDRQFKAQQAALDRNASNATQSQAAVQYVRNPNGGYNLINATGEKNNTLDLASYVTLNGGNVSNLLSLLSEGDSQDKKAVQNYYNNIQKGLAPDKAYAQLKKDRPTAFYKGGNVGL